MPTIKLIEYNGQSHTIDAEAGKSLMLNAVEHAVPGIDADCGGAGACGTCHCFVEAEWQANTGDPDILEESMRQLSVLSLAPTCSKHTMSLNGLAAGCSSGSFFTVGF